MIDFFGGFSSDSKQLLNEIKEEGSEINLKKSDGKFFNFNTFKPSLKYASSIYKGKITLEEAKKYQYKMLKHLKDLEKNDPKNPEKKNSKKETLINAEELYNNKGNVIKAFEDGIFPFNNGFYQKEESNMADKALPDWVKVDKKRFDMIKMEIQNAKNKNKFVVLGGVVTY